MSVWSVRGSRLREPAGERPKIRILYPWQEQAIEAIRNHSRSILTAPTGSGKTAVIAVSSVIRQSSGRKSLIVVPSTQVAESFRKLSVSDRSGTHYTYDTLDVLPRFLFGSAGRSQTESSISKDLAAWFENPDPRSAGIAVTCSGTLVAAFKRMQDEGRAQPETFSNLFVVQDEAHHLSAAASADDGVNVEEMNEIARFHSFLLTETDAHLLMVSATPFRGDRIPLFQKGADEKFDGRFTRKFEDHWADLGFEAFYFNFVSYSGDPTERILDVLKAEPHDRHIICLPPDTTSFRKLKPDWVSNLIRSLHSIGIPPDEIVDLVTSGDEAIENAKIKLREDNEKYQEGKTCSVRVVVSVNMMREGSDWVPATRVHELAPSKSTTWVAQTCGRMFRKDPCPEARGPNDQKKVVAYYAYFRNLEDRADEAEIWDHITDRTNVAFTGLLAVRQMFLPVFDDWDERDEERPEAARGRLSLSDAMEKYLGKTMDTVQTVLLTVLESSRREANGTLTSTHIEEAIRKAAALVPDSDPIAVRNVLRRIAGFYVESFAQGNASPEIHPTLETDSEGEWIHPASIREKFNYTERSEGLFCAKTFGNSDRFQDLRGILEHAIPTSTESLILSNRMGGLERKGDVGAANRRENSLRRKMKRSPGKATAQEKRLLGRARERKK